MNRAPRTRLPSAATAFGAVVGLVVVGLGARSATAGATDVATSVSFDVGGQKVVRLTTPKGVFQRCRFRFSGGNTPSVPSGWSGTEWWYMADSQRGLGLRTIYSLYYRPKGADTLEAASRAWGESLPATCRERGWDCPTAPKEWEKGKLKFGPVMKATYPVSHPGLHPKAPLKGLCWTFQAGESFVVFTTIAMDEGDLSGAMLAGLTIDDVPPAPPTAVHAQFMENLVPFTYVTIDVARPWFADHSADLETSVAGWALRQEDAIVARMLLRGDFLDVPAVLKEYVEARRASYVATYQEVLGPDEVKDSGGLKGATLSFVEPVSDSKPKAWTTRAYFPLGTSVWSLEITTTEPDEAKRAVILKSFRDHLKTLHIWGAVPK